MRLKVLCFFLLLGASLSREVSAQSLSHDLSEDEGKCLFFAAKQMPSISGTSIKSVDISPNRARSNADLRFYEIRALLDIAGNSANIKMICSVDIYGGVKVF